MQRAPGTHDTEDNAPPASAFAPGRSANAGVHRGRRSGTPGAIVPTARRSGGWHDLSGENAVAGDDDDLLIAGADGEEFGVVLLEDAQHVGDLLAGIWAGPTPADHDALADVGRCQPDLGPEPH